MSDMTDWEDEILEIAEDVGLDDVEIVYEPSRCMYRVVVESPEGSPWCVEIRDHQLDDIDPDITVRSQLEHVSRAIDQQACIHRYQLTKITEEKVVRHCAKCGERKDSQIAQ